MKLITKKLLWLTNLKIAIALLLLIALLSGVGTLLPQGDSPEKYIEFFSDKKFLGFISGEQLLFLQLDHIYTSYGFLSLLIWLGISLIVCSWKRQLPILMNALRWSDYKSPNKIKKLLFSESFTIKESKNIIENLRISLLKHGWKIKLNENRLSARKGAIGRVGPIIVHLGLILLMFGSIFSVFYGYKTEHFLAPGENISLISKDGKNKLDITVEEFKIERDSSGRIEQFISKIKLIDQDKIHYENVSVNNPIRFRGLTIYQADWLVYSIKINVNNNPPINLPLSKLEKAENQIWGVVLPTKNGNQDPILLSTSSEIGPLQIYSETGDFYGNLLPGGSKKNINGNLIGLEKIYTKTGLLFKRDPGVPLVYSGFLVTIIGGFLSIISTHQLWALFEKDKNILHVGGMSNRNVSGFSIELSNLIINTIKH